MKPIIFLFALVMGTDADAQTFNVSLGGKTLGVMQVQQSGNAASLRSTLNNTPMGVFNGAFTGTSTGSSANSIFVGDSASSRKRRVVTVEIAGGRAVRTDITPAEEMTTLSDTNLVPEGITDPVRAIGALVDARGCPGAMQMYDGRRVVRFSPTGETTTDDTLTCNMGYRVTDGPGHLSPLGIKSAKLQLTYVTTNTTQSLQQIKVSSGIFQLSLDRAN